MSLLTTLMCSPGCTVSFAGWNAKCWITMVVVTGLGCVVEVVVEAGTVEVVVEVVESVEVVVEVVDVVVDEVEVVVDVVSVVALPFGPDVDVADDDGATRVVEVGVAPLELQAASRKTTGTRTLATRLRLAHLSPALYPC